MISDRLLSSRNRRRHRKLSHEQLEDRRVLAGVPGSIYGYVFEDLNADGIENPGEPRLNGITIDLMQTGGGTISTVTSDFDVDGNGVIDPATESGIYRFLDLIDGEEYQVLFPGVAGAFQTTTDPAALTATGGIAFVAVPGLSGTGSEVVVPELAIGISYLGSIHGFKFFDVNGDGIYDPAVDSGQPDVEFTLTGIDALGNNVDLSVQTDANGEFWFEQLVPSVRPIDPFPGGPTGYTVTETVPDGFVPTTPTSSTLNLFSRNELVWEPGAANLDPPPPPMIDQQQLVTSGGTQPVRDIVIAAQTFIPGIQGSLTDVDISVSTTAGVGDVTLEVRTVNDLGEPDAIIRSVTVPAVEVPLGDNQNLNFDFSADPAFLSLDTSYALVLTSATSAMSSLGWDRSTFSTYPDGTSYVSLDNGALWFSFPDMDQVFTTVMQGQGDPREEVLVGEALMFGNTSETGISSSIHGFKFLDLNGDGIYEPGVGPDGGERPMAGVEFTLTGNDVEGNPVDLSTMTDDTGQFWFTGLVTSEQGVGLGTGYTVTEIPPAGFGTTSPLGLDRFFDLPEGTELAWEEGAAMLPPGDPRVEVVVGDQLMWGNASLGSIHGFKFDDVNGNGIFDPGEGPRANVQFELTGTDAQGVPVNEIAVTDDTGQFWFTDLFPSVAGAGLGTGYTVTEIVESPFIATTPISRTFDLYSGQELVWEDGAAMLPPGDPRMEVLVGEELMFGNTTSASIHGFKFEDLDADGVFDPGEPALEGVEFQLTGTDSLGNVLNLMAFTDVNGEFWFEGLLPSVAGVGGQTGYTVTEVVPSGFVPTTTLARDFNLPSGVEYVWEAGAANLPDGDPRVEEVVGDALIWGNTVPGSVHGFKFIDANGDGVYDPAVDTPQANVEFTLTGTDGLGNVVNQTMTTDDTGQFWFTDLIPSVDGEGAGTGYTVTEILPEGFLPTTALERFFNLTSRQELAWEEGAAMLPPGDPRMEVVVGEELMWGNMPLLGQIHGYKFEDLNNDGVPDPGEPRLEGWEIQLLDDSGAFITSVLTDANGEYWFTELDPGTYFVREVQQLGWVQTTHNPPPIVILTDEVYVAELGQGMLGPEDPREEILEKCLIFGNRLTSSVHGYKFEDVNGNGVDDGEPRLAGVTITLTGDSDGDGLVETLFAVTDDNGEYWFEDLVFGTYTVDEVVPAGMVPTTSLPVTLTLLSGEEQVAVSGQAVIGPDQFETVNTDLAIGNAFYAAIHGYKFLDANRNGMDDGEPRLPGVTITLTGMDGLGQAVNRVTQTDVNGLYWFTDLLPGEYTVTETPPTGSIPTTDTFAEVTLESGEVEVAQLGIAMGPLGPGQFETENPALAFGNYYPGSIHGHKFEDINGDGVEDPGEPRLNGWTITLTDQEGNPVFDFFGNEVEPVVTSGMDVNGDGMISANEEGLYWFTDLLPGTYVVREVQQDGFYQTTHNPQPIAITGGQVYVAQRDQVDIPETDPREVIVDKCLAFGNQIRGQVTWEKVDKFGELLGGVIFTLTRTHSYDPVTDTFTDIIDEPTVVQDNLFPDINPVFGQFRVIHLPLGSYTLEETFPIPGYDPDTTVVSFNLTDTDPFFNVEDPFVNTWSKRAFVGSTYAARQAYLESIGLTLNTQELAPVDDAVLIPADAVRYPLANVLMNDFEQHGDDPLTIVDVGIPSMGGTAELIDGMIYYTPSYAFDTRLVESFSYTVTNGTVTETAMITPYSHGAASRLDLNADGFIAPLDALLVIRELNVDGPRPLQEFETPDATAADTNGDRYLSALDALLVLHHMTESPTTFQAIMAPPQTPGSNTAALDYVFRQLDEDDPL